MVIKNILLALAFVFSTGTFPAGLNADTWRFVSAGYSHTVAIRTDGSLWAWGRNVWGQLGDDTTTDRHSPVRIGANYEWRFVSAGYNHTVAIGIDGSLWTWGNNRYGQLGDNRTIPRFSPGRIDAATHARWENVSSGRGFTLAVRTDGSLWAWGRNDSGQLGLGDRSRRLLPTRVIRYERDGVWPLWVSAGRSHALVSGFSSLFLAWGRNDQGQVGDGTIVERHAPVPIGRRFIGEYIYAGDSHSMAICLRDSPDISMVFFGGTLWAWGENFWGQLGDGTTTNRNAPVRIGTDYWREVSAGGSHTVAVRIDGSLWAWGANGAGQLGNGSTDDRHSPTRIGTDYDWNFVFAGGRHTLALRKDGTLWAWGANGAGQLGDGTRVTRLTPVRIMP